MRHTARIRLVVAALALCAAAALLAACGSSSATSQTSSGPDPATLVPAGAPLYGDFVVNPQGATSDAVNSLLGTLTGGADIGAKIVQGLDRRLAKNGITYEADIKPWLGNDIGAFATKLGAGAGGAALAPTSDPGAAMATFEKAAKSSPQDGKLTAATYRGIDYDVQGSTVFGTVGDFFVAGTEGAFKAVVDTSMGASSLADSSGYTAALQSAPAGRLFTAYADPKAIIDAVAKTGALPAAQADSILQQFGSSAGQPVAAWVDATSTSLGLTVSAPKPASTSSSGGSLIADFPSDSWLAFGASNVGQGFQLGLKQLQSLSASGGVPGYNQAQAFKRLKGLTGFDIQNLGRWLTSLSGYASGSSIFSLGGALVLGTSDERASAQTLTEIQALLEKDRSVAVSPLGAGRTGFTVVPSGAPVQIVFEQTGGKVVVGLGPSSVDSVLSPSSKLGDSASYKAAAGALGDGLNPSFYLDFQPIASFASLAQASSPNPQLQQVQPYLDRLDYLVAGTATSGDRVESRIVLGVRDGSSSSGVTATVTP